MRSFQKKWISLLLLVIFTWQYVLVTAYEPTTLRQFFQASLDVAATLLSAGEASAALLDETPDRLPMVSDDTFSFGIGDVDGDDDPDVVVANVGQSRLLINEGGMFADETADRLPALTGVTRAAALADFDGDGAVDLFLPNASGQNHLLINDGTGHFSDETAARLPTLNQVSMGVKHGDLDGDGDFDLVVTNRGSQNRILLNNGYGVFADRTSSLIVADSDPSSDVALADIDGNKTLDLLVVNHAAQNRLFLNNGLGAFTEVTASHLPAAAGNSSQAVFIDVDGDGDPDMLVAEGEQGLRLLVNDSQGAFTDESAGQLPVLTDFVIKVAAGDINYDGALDLVLANAGQDRLLLNGSFVDATDSELPADSRRSFGVAVFDADGDFDPDLLFGTPGGQNRVLLNNIAFPRLRVAVTPDYVESGDPVTVTVEAFDEDGIASIDLTVSQPDASQVSLPLVNGTATFTPTIAGDYSADVTAVDASGLEGQRSVPFTVQTPDVTPPQVSLTYDAPDPLVVGQKVTIQVTATDDRAVAETSLTVNGSPVPLDVAGNGIYVTTEPGLHTAAARAVDPAGNEAAADTTFTVAADTEPPIVGINVAPDPADLRNPVAVSVSATDNVAVANLSLRVFGPGIQNGRDLPLDPDGQASFTPYLPGLYDLEAVALDPSGNQGLGNAMFEARGVPDTTPPVVTLEVDPRTVAIGGSVTLTVDAIDDEGVESVLLEIDGSPVTLDAFGSFEFIPPQVGEYTAVAGAQDFTGNQSTVTKTFRAVDPALDTSPPVVSISLPEADAQLTAPTQIIGTATDETLVGYTLEYSPRGENQFTTFATGDMEVVDDALGTLDTTLLLNDLYDIRLTAEDINGLTASNTVVYGVSEDLRVGNFIVTFRDLFIPVAGLPITINRTYDSRDKTRQDFGVGWSLDIQTFKIKENRVLGTGWTQTKQDGFIPVYCIEPVGAHYVSVTLPDGRTEAFDMAVNPRCQQLVPIDLTTVEFIARPGTSSSLQALAENDLQFFNGELLDLEFTLYDPVSYRLTTSEGMVFDLDQTFGARNMTDPNGNTLTFGHDGITHSAGKQVLFTRDSQGRITQITDPSGGTLTYDYDASGDLVAVTDQEGKTTRYRYNRSHGLTDIEDPRGIQPARNLYDHAGRLTTHIDTNGNRIEYTHDLVGRQEIVQDRRGNITVYEYDESGNVLSQIDPLGNTTTFTYDARGNRLTEVDPLGNVATFTYDLRDNLLTETDPLGNTSTYTYNAQNLMLTINDPLGNTTAYTYDTRRNLLTTVDPFGNTTTHTYDAQGNVTSVADSLGNKTIYAYDSVGNLIRQTDPHGHKTTFTYDSNGNQLTQSTARTDALGNTVIATTTNVYDGMNRLVESVDPLGNTTRIEYNAIGKRSAIVDKNGHRTEYAYDPVGNLVKTTYADGTTDRATYDADGNRLSVTDRMGRTTRFEYNARNERLRTIFPDGSGTSNEYDAVGRVVATIDENGNRTAYAYDAAGRKTTVMDALGNVTTLTYDANGRQTSMTDANGNTTTFVNDALGRKVGAILPDGMSTSMVYDDLGRGVSQTDPAGIATNFDPDALGKHRLTRVVDALGNETIYTYDEVGNRLTQTDANGNRTRWTYDSLGRVVSHVLPLGMTATTEYDPNGNVLSRTDFNGQTVTYTYDSNNRLTRKAYPDGTQERFTYTPTGRAETVTDASGITSFSYDLRDRLTQVSHPDGTILAYTYDPRGNRTSIEAPSGITMYTYDALNRLRTVTAADGGLTTYAYDAAGNKTSLVYPNGGVTTYSYDTRNRLVSVSNTQSDGNLISSYNCTLGPAGNRLRVEEHTGRTVDYTYDALYRLVEESISNSVSGNQTISYTYDPVGNRLTKTDANGTTSYIYDANDRLLAGGSIIYTYDDNGNTLSRTDGASVTTYSYDVENRLLFVQTPDREVAYGYDADGTRVRSIVDGVVTEYLVDKNRGSRWIPDERIGSTALIVGTIDENRGLPQVLEERDESSALIVNYTFGDDLISQHRNGNPSYYHYDGLGSTRALTDESETITDTYTYEGFGNLLEFTGSTTNNYLFTGEQYDPNVRLYYLRARYYSPETARFMTTDPWKGSIHDPRSLHRYVYTLNDPVNRTDPSGKTSLIGLAIGLVIGTLLVYLATSYFPKKYFYRRYVYLDFSEMPDNINDPVIRDRVFNVVKDDFIFWSYVVEITDSVPNQPYKHVRFLGDSWFFPDRVLGIGYWHSARVYVDHLFVNRRPNHFDEIVYLIGNVASHETGHMYTLEHVNGNYIMKAETSEAFTSNLNWSRTSESRLDRIFESIR